MTKLLLFVVGLLIVLGVGDRVTAKVAAGEIAKTVRQSQGLPVRPDVHVGGLPFLTQAVAGRYREITLNARDLRVDDVRVARLDATLTGVHVPLGDVLGRRVTDVPVDHLRGTVLLGYDDLSARLRSRGLTVGAAGEQVRVTGMVTVLGQTLRASADSDVRVGPSGSSLIITARRFQVGNALADSALSAAIGGRFDFVVRTSQLPFDLTVREVRVTPDGLLIEAAGDGVTLKR